jgi:hypothetical protein
VAPDSGVAAEYDICSIFLYETHMTAPCTYMLSNFHAFRHTGCVYDVLLVLHLSTTWIYLFFPIKMGISLAIVQLIICY